MPLYRVALIGTGFRKVVDGREGRHGFLTNAFVEADTAQLAGEKAVAELGARSDLQRALNADGATLAIEEVVEWPEADTGCCSTRARLVRGPGELMKCDGADCA